METSTMVQGPDNHAYRIVSLRPADVSVSGHGGGFYGPTLRKVVTRVFDEENDVLFDVRSTVVRQDAPDAQAQTASEARQRILSGDWARDSTYEI